MGVDFKSSQKYNDIAELKKGGGVLSPRTGRPKVENPKRNDLKVRLDDETLKRLRTYCQAQGLTTAEAVRQGIYLLLAQKK